MTQAVASGKVDYRLRQLMSDLLICSRCLKAGKITPVPQILSARHTPRNRCRQCSQPGPDALRRSFARLVPI